MDYSQNEFKLEGRISRSDDAIPRRPDAQPGEHRIEMLVGTVTTTLHECGEVTVENVPSYRTAKGVAVNAIGYGPVTGDVAWGGNWFFLVHDHGQRIALDRVEQLTEFTWQVRQALEGAGISGSDGQAIDVLCPGKAYDRSPCGTGTSAKLACLAADGILREGDIWRQESVVGSLFEGSYRWAGDHILPSIRRSAWADSEATLVVDRRDPFRAGIRR